MLVRKEEADLGLAHALEEGAGVGADPDPGEVGVDQRGVGVVLGRAEAGLKDALRRVNLVVVEKDLEAVPSRAKVKSLVQDQEVENQDQDLLSREADQRSHEADQPRRKIPIRIK